MKVVVDTNIIFSALLSSEGKIGHLLFNSLGLIEFYGVTFLKKEIGNHKEKIMFISGFNQEELAERESLVYSQIKFIDEFLLPQAYLISAEELVRHIDPDDTLHVALAEYLNAKLWTGDKKLIDGLEKKHYKNFIRTPELWDFTNGKIDL